MWGEGRGESVGTVGKTVLMGLCPIFVGGFICYIARVVTYKVFKDGWSI